MSAGRRVGELLSFIVLLLPLGAVEPMPAAPARANEIARSYRIGHENQIVGEFLQFLTIPNTAATPDDLERNGEFVTAMMRARGIETEWLRWPGAPPVIFGQLRTPGAVRTIGFYAHYDGQPVTQPSWSSSPFSATVRDPATGAAIETRTKTHFDPEWRIWARSASDDKAAIVGLMTAVEALEHANLPIKANLKFLFEGEEESGSPHLAEILDQHRQQLAADAWLICDGPIHPSGRQQLFFGVRGLAQLEITVYGPLRALHSGTYGNWAPNPIADLVQLLSRLRAPDGTISIPGFYRAVRRISAAERAALAEVPREDQKLRIELALGRTEGHGRPLAEQVMQPALNLRGISAGETGFAAANAIQERATASIDFRLVPDETPAEVRTLTEDYLEKLGYFIIHTDPDRATRLQHPRVARLEWGSGYPAFRTPVNSATVAAIIQTVKNASDTHVILMPTLGGSSPMYALKVAANTPIIGVPIANHDNNQHAANENIRLRNLWNGIELYGALMAMSMDEGASPPGEN